MRVIPLILLLYIFHMIPLHAQDYRAELNGADCRISILISRPATSFDPHSGNLALELLDAIEDAEVSIDLAAYDLDHPLILQSLLDARARGVRVRVLMDSKAGDDGDWATMPNERRFRNVDRLIMLEKLALGPDGVPSNDDIQILSDAPILPITDAPMTRKRFGLEAEPSFDAGLSTPFLRETSSQSRNFSPSTLSLHNKYLVIDRNLVVTGSANYTVSSLSGGGHLATNGLNHEYREAIVSVKSVQVAELYEQHFSFFWGLDSDANQDYFSQHGRLLLSQAAPMDLEVCNDKMSVLFTPSLNAEEYLVDLVIGAQREVLFEAFAFSNDDLFDALFQVANDRRVGISGIIDRTLIRFFEADAEAHSSAALQFFFGQNRGRWGRDRIERSRLPGKLHIKMLIIDALSEGFSRTVLGSLNFSEAAFSNSFENVIVFNHLEISEALRKFHFEFSRDNFSHSPLRCYYGGLDLDEDLPNYVGVN